MSTLHMREWTHPGMLLQSPALESASADTPGVGTKRGAEAGLPAAGVQHEREETTGGSPAPSGVTGRRGTPEGQEAGSDPRTTVQKVFVLDRHGKPLMPCHPARARELLHRGRARVARHAPFTIRLTDRTVEESVVCPLVLGVDPGSRHTGLALARQSDAVDQTTGEITTVREGVYLAQVDHRGAQIHKRLGQRSALRRRRRSANLRYRAPRFNNRHPEKCESCGGNAQQGKRYCRPCQALPRAERGHGGRDLWLAPSVHHRVDTTLTWVRRLMSVAPVGEIAYEAGRFDMQVIQDPDIAGVGYQQGTLRGTEIREYVLTRDNHTCVYCEARGVGPGAVPLNLDHVHPKSKGGSDRPSNLVTSCVPCNQAKDNMWVEDYLKDRPDVLARVNRHRKQPLKDAAAVNATRHCLHMELSRLGVPVRAWSGGRTKYNRTQTDTPKAHALDALCVGEVDRVSAYPGRTLVVSCAGRGQHQRTRLDRYGFPRGYLTRTKTHYGFATGDLVRAVVPTGKHRGTHIGRVAVRASGSFNITTPAGTIQGINHRYCTLLQRGDGYAYATIPTLDTHTQPRKENATDQARATSTTTPNTVSATA